jgi:hypothetical protein
MKKTINFEKHFGPLKTDVLGSIEQAYNITLPKDYRDFLLVFNGGKPIESEFSLKDSSNSSLVAGFFGITDSKDYNLLFHYVVIYTGRIPSNTIPIADDQCGNIILLSVKGQDRGKVYFWDHEREADPSQGEKPSYDNLTLIADSFEEFINNLKAE